VAYWRARGILDAPSRMPRTQTRTMVRESKRVSAHRNGIAHAARRSSLQSIGEQGSFHNARALAIDARRNVLQKSAHSHVFPEERGPPGPHLLCDSRPRARIVLCTHCLTTTRPSWCCQSNFLWTLASRPSRWPTTTLAHRTVLRIRMCLLLPCT